MKSLRPAEVRRRWADFQKLRNNLFDQGGLTIESPSGQCQGEPLHARTVIQPDGDVLWFVHEESEAHAALLRAHCDKVADWYRQANTTLSNLSACLKMLRATAATIAYGCTAAGLWSWWGLTAAVIAPVLVQLIARAVLGRLLRKGMAATLS